jgi:hypothetical protein
MTLKEKWIWDPRIKKMVRVMAIVKSEEPMTVYVKADVDSTNGIDATVLDDTDSEVLGAVNYEIKCPQCKTTTKIVGELQDNVFTMKDPLFACPDCHVEIPLLIRKGVR